MVKRQGLYLTSDSFDSSSRHVTDAAWVYKDDDRRRPRSKSLDYLSQDESIDIDLYIVRRLTKDMADRGRKLGIHLQSLHEQLPASDANDEQYLPEELADELRKRTTSVDSEIKQLENQMGQLQRTLVKGKARRESIKHRISVSSTPAGSRKVSAMTPYLPTPEQPEEMSKEDLKARLEALENEKQELLEDKKDLNDEIKFLKYQLQYRLEVQNLQSERDMNQQSESHVKLENENKALREENKDLKERLSVIRTKLTESGNTEETLLSVTDVVDSEDGRDEYFMESELDRLYTERKILLSTIMRMQNLDREDPRKDSVPSTDYGVQCDLDSPRDHPDSQGSSLIAKLTNEIEALRKSLHEVEHENEELSDENRALDEENAKLTEEKRTLEDTINKLRAQINDTLDTTLEEIEHLHSFNEELESKLNRTDAQGRVLSQSLKELNNRNYDALENVLNDIEHKSSLSDAIDYLRKEIRRIKDDSNEFVERNPKIEIQDKSNESKDLTSNLLNEVKTCKEMLESQRSHIRELQMDKRDIEEGYAKMRRELLILRSNRQKERKKEWLAKRRAKSMNDGLAMDQDSDRTIMDENDSLKREIKRLHSTKTHLDDVILGVKKDKQTLEEEKVCLLGSLYHQLERNETLEVQVEELTAVLEQWEAKSDLRDSGFFLPEEKQENTQSDDASQETGAQTTGEDKGVLDTVGSKPVTPAEPEKDTPPEDQPISDHEDDADEKDEKSRMKNALVTVVDSATGESQEMKHKIHTLAESLKSVQESVCDLEIERDNLQLDLEESKKNEKELRAVIVQLKRENSSTRDKLVKANDLAQTLQDCLKEAHDEKEDLKDSLEEANDEKIVAKKHSELLDGRLKEVTQQRDALKTEVESLKADDDELKAKCEKAEEKLKEIHKMLDDIGKLSPSSEEEGEEEKVEFGKTEKSKEDGEKCIDELGKDIISWLGTVFVDVHRAKKELKRTNSEQNRLKNRLDVVITEREALRKYVREVDDKKRQMKMFITKLTEEKEKLSEQIDDTRQQKTNLADALENVYQSKEKLQHRLDEALCKQDQYKNSLVEAVDEAKTLKESLYRIINEHETMKESLLNANREIGRLKCENTAKNLDADRKEDQEDEEVQREGENNKDNTAADVAETNALKERVQNLLEAVETAKSDLKTLQKEKDETTKSENELKTTVKILTRENEILKSHFEKHAAEIDGKEIIASFTAEKESAPSGTLEVTEGKAKESPQDQKAQYPLLSGLWNQLKVLGTEVQSLQTRISELQRENENLNQTIQETSDKNERRVEELISENSKLRENTSLEKKDNNEEEVQQLREWYDVICKEKEQLERELECTTKDNEDLMQDFKRVSAEKEELRICLGNREEDRASMEDVREEGEMKGYSKSDIQQLMEGIEKENEALKEKLQESVSHVEQLEGALEVIKEENDQLRKMEADGQELQADFEKQLESLVESTDQLMQEKVEVIQTLEGQNAKIEAEKEQLLSELKTQKEKLNTVIEELDDTKSTLEIIKESNEKLKQRNKECELKIEESKGDKNKEGLISVDEASKEEVPEAVATESLETLEAAPGDGMGRLDIEDELDDALNVYQQLKTALDASNEDNVSLRERENKYLALLAESEKKIDELMVQKDKLLKEKVDLVNSLHEKMSEMNDEKDKLDDENKQLLDEKSREVTDLKGEVKKAQDDADSVKRLVDAIIEENDTLKQSEHDLLAIQEDLEHTIDELVAEKQKLIQENSALVSSLHAEKEEMYKTIEKLQQERNMLHESFIATENDLEISIKETVNLEKQVEMLSRESSTMKQEAEERIKKLIELEEKAIETMEKKLEIAEYAAGLKYKKESLEKKCAELSAEIQNLQQSRDVTAADKSRINDEVCQLKLTNAKTEADLAETRNALRIEKQDIEVLKIKLGSMDRKNKELADELSKSKNLENGKATEMVKKNEEKNNEIEEMREKMRKANDEIEKILSKNSKLSDILNELNSGIENILNEETLPDSDPNVKLQKLREKIENLEKQVNNVKEEAEKNVQEKDQLTGFLHEVNQEMDVILKDDVQRVSVQTSEAVISERVKGEHGQNGFDTEPAESSKGKSETSLIQLTSKIEKLKVQLQESSERERNLLEQLQYVRDDNKRFTQEITTKTNFLKTINASLQTLEQENKQFAKKAADKAMKLDETRQMCSDLKQEVVSLTNELQVIKSSKRELEDRFNDLEKEHDVCRQLTTEKPLKPVEHDSLRESPSCQEEVLQNQESIQEIGAEFMLGSPIDSIQSEQVPLEKEFVVEVDSQVMEACPEDVDSTTQSREMQKTEVMPLDRSEVMRANLDRIVALEEERNQLKNELRLSEDKLHEAEQKFEKLEVALSQLESISEVFHSGTENVDALKKEIRDRDKSIGELTEKIETLEKDNSSVQSEYKETKEKLKKRSSSLQEKLGVSKNFMQKILDENEELKGRIADIEKSNASLSESLESLRKTDEALKVKFEEVMAEKSDLNLKCSKTEGEAAELRERLVARKDLMHSLEKDRENFKTSLRESQKQNEDLTSMVNELKEERRNEKQKKEEAEGLVEKLKVQRNQMIKEIEELKSEKGLLEQKQQMQDEAQKLRNEIEVLKKLHAIALEDVNQKSEKDLRREKMKKERYEKDVESLRKQMNDDKNRAYKQETLIQSIKTENDKFKKRLEQEIKDKENKNLELQRLTNQIEDFKTKLSEVEGRVKAANSEKKTIEDEVKKLRVTNSDLRMRIEETVEDKEELEEILGEMRDKRKRLHDDIEKALNERDDFEDELLELKKNVKLDKEGTDLQINTLKEKLEATEKAQAPLQTKIKELERKTIQLLRERRDSKREFEGKLSESEKERSPLLEKIEALENENRDLVKQCKELSRNLLERRRETEAVKKEMVATEKKVKLFLEKQNLLEEKLLLLQKTKEELRQKETELHEAREEITVLMNRIESSKDKQIKKVMKAVCEDIEAVEEKELHAAVVDQLDSAPSNSADREEVTRLKIENMRMKARLEAADGKLMNLQDELHKTSKDRVIDEKTIKDKESENKTLKEEEQDLKRRLRQADNVQLNLRKDLEDLQKEKEELRKENENLKKRKLSIVEKVKVTSSECAVASQVSQVPDLGSEPVAKASSMESAQNEIIMLENQAKNLRKQILKARDKNFDLTHEVSDKERQLRLQERLHNEETKRLKAEIAELEKELDKVKRELQHSVEFERKRSTFSTVKELHGMHRKTEDEMKEVIEKTAEYLKRSKEGTCLDNDDKKTIDAVIEEKQKIERALEDSQKTKERLLRRLKKTEENNSMLREIVADLVIEVDKVRRLVGFYTGIGGTVDENGTKSSDKENLVKTLDTMSPSDTEDLQVTLNGLRTKIQELEKGLQEQKEKGDSSLHELLKSRNSKLEAELSNTIKEKERALEKLRYIQDELRRIIESGGTKEVNSRQAIQKLVESLVSEREEQETIQSEFSKLQNRMKDMEQTEQNLKLKLGRLKEEIETMNKRKTSLVKEVRETRNIKDDKGKESKGLPEKIQALEERNKKLEVQVIKGKQAYDKVTRDQETMKQRTEALVSTIKEIEDEKESLIQETHVFKRKLESRIKELTECIEGKELEAISLRAQNEGLATSVRKLEGQVRVLEKDKDILNSSVNHAETRRHQLEMALQEQHDEIQEMILQKSRENFVGEQLEKLFYENTRLKEQKKILQSRIESLEKDLKVQIHTKRDSESDREDLLVRLDKQQEELRRMRAQAEHWKRMLEKHDAESQLQIDAMSKLVEKLRHEKKLPDNRESDVDQRNQEIARLEEENSYLRGLLGKSIEEAKKEPGTQLITEDLNRLKKENTKLRELLNNAQEDAKKPVSENMESFKRIENENEHLRSLLKKSEDEAIEIKKENSLLRRACEQLRDRRNASRESLRESFTSSTSHALPNNSLRPRDESRGSSSSSFSAQNGHLSPRKPSMQRGQQQRSSTSSISLVQSTQSTKEVKVKKEGPEKRSPHSTRQVTVQRGPQGGSSEQSTREITITRESPERRSGQRTREAVVQRHGPEETSGQLTQEVISQSPEELSVQSTRETIIEREELKRYPGKPTREVIKQREDPERNSAQPTREVAVKMESLERSPSQREVTVYRRYPEMSSSSSTSISRQTKEAKVERIVADTRQTSTSRSQPRDPPVQRSNSQRSSSPTKEVTVQRSSSQRGPPSPSAHKSLQSSHQVQRSDSERAFSSVLNDPQAGDVHTGEVITQTTATSLRVQASFPPSAGYREISLSVPRSRNKEETLNQQSYKFSYKTTPQESILANGSAERMEESQWHTTPRERRDPRRSPQSGRRSRSLPRHRGRSLEGHGDEYSRHYSCSPILNAMGNCPVHQHAAGDPSQQQCPVCKKERSVGGRRENGITENYV
ncbi:centrosomal protein of 290 kDa isoform X2 [Nematostella vectensis]|uniref:centrosomal protein of 290 kDa isoform X2 n=1 Tax=Nematostella vectensis TaxID=45351 RepID=UPI0020775385|nr:centrosomal protein of 290 kDa isoform X2 [Nematostella vectensis]